MEQNQAQKKPSAANNQSRTRMRQRMASMLCVHCSRIAGVNKYHEGLKGGGPESNCPYDKSGKRRPGKRFISHIFDTAVNELDIPDFQEAASEGLTYEEDDSSEKEINQLGVDLLTGALGQYNINE